MIFDRLPPSLESLRREPLYSQFKDLLRQRRAAFKANRKARIDLEAYSLGDQSHDYTELRGLVPTKLIGDASAGGGMPYRKSDTFFTDFAKHHSKEYILSATEHSLIIGNKSSHDVRQYTAEWNPSHKDKSSSAGMSYFHFMVIPTRKVYNVVSIEDASIVEEMIAHFQNFWSRADAVQKCNARIQLAVDLRAREVVRNLQQNQKTAVARLSEFEALMRDVQKSTDEFSVKLKDLTADDFILGFHAMPDASVGHLHMHVLSAPVEFRRFSTCAHDWKTIPAEAVLEALHEEEVSQSASSK